MLYKIKDLLNRRRFDWSVRLGALSSVVSTKPRGLAVLSQLRRSDLMMYLAAIKTFSDTVPVSRVYVLNDGSLGDREKEILRERISNLEILALRDYQIEGLPTGGTWERLIAIAQLSEKEYVVQLDADTLTLGDLPEVTDAWETGRSFVIGTWDGQDLEDAKTRSEKSGLRLRKGSKHVQIIAESHFSELQASKPLRYVRGCSGFSGFAPGGEKLDFIRSISTQMEKTIGPKWLEWGSEQVMSNIVISNQPKAFVLPHPKYSDCNKMAVPKTKFVHFIGPCRFTGGRYAEMVNQALRNR